MARSERYRRHQRVRETTSPRYTPSTASPAVTGVLLDSDIVIETLRGRRQVSDGLRAIEQRGLPTYCCAYLARYSRSHGVRIADALVAAAASVAGLRLWTLNRRHYPMSDLAFYDG